MVPAYDDAENGMISSSLNNIWIVNDADRTFSSKDVSEVGRVPDKNIKQKLNCTIEFFARNEAWLTDWYC